MVNTHKQAKEDKRIKEEMQRRQEQYQQRIKEARNAVREDSERKKEAKEKDQAAYKKTIKHDALRKKAILKKKRKNMLMIAIGAVIVSGALLWLFGVIRTVQ